MFIWLLWIKKNQGNFMCSALGPKELELLVKVYDQLDFSTVPEEAQRSKQRLIRFRVALRKLAVTEKGTLNETRV
jgi:hypothetical protein